MAGRNRKKRLGLLAALVLAIGALGAGAAFAAHQTIVAGDNFFGAAQYTTDQGEAGVFQNAGVNQHNVTANATGPDGKALFRSNTIGTGQARVDGTQYLTAGTYTFTCTVHPEMQSSLVVSGSGSPQPRPSQALRITNKTISSAVKSGILVQVTNTAKVDGVSLTAKLGNTTLGSLTNLAQAQGIVFEKITLSKAAKNKLKKKKKASVTVTAEVPFGAPASTKKKLK